MTPDAGRRSFPSQQVALADSERCAGGVTPTPCQHTRYRNTKIHFPNHKVCSSDLQTSRLRRATIRPRNRPDKPTLTETIRLTNWRATAARPRHLLA